METFENRGLSFRSFPETLTSQPIMQSQKESRVPLKHAHKVRKSSEKKLGIIKRYFHTDINYFRSENADIFIVFEALKTKVLERASLWTGLVFSLDYNIGT